MALRLPKIVILDLFKRSDPPSLQYSIDHRLVGSFRMSRLLIHRQPCVVYKTEYCVNSNVIVELIFESLFLRAEKR